MHSRLQDTADGFRPSLAYGAMKHNDASKLEALVLRIHRYHFELQGACQNEGAVELRHAWQGRL